MCTIAAHESRTRYLFLTVRGLKRTSHTLLTNGKINQSRLPFDLDTAGGSRFDEHPFGFRLRNQQTGGKIEWIVVYFDRTELFTIGPDGDIFQLMSVRKKRSGGKTTIEHLQRAPPDDERFGKAGRALCCVDDPHRDSVSRQAIGGGESDRSCSADEYHIF